MRKILVGSLLVAGLAVGTLTVTGFDPVGAVTAAVSGQSQGKVEAGPLAHALDDLVVDGTLNQGQADAVSNGVKANRAAAGGRRPFVKKLIASVSAQLGIAPKDLVVELRSGKSIAGVASDKGVDPQSIITTLVTSIDARIDQAVTNAKMTQERADQLKAKVTPRVTAFVNKVHAHAGGGPK
jgi:hypothetical protein